MTHADLVARAAQWLHARRCVVVVTELRSGHETPDAMGWRQAFSTVIECKASRADFRADAKKFFRKHEYLGLGYSRYYMTPPGLIREDEIPSGWGLLEAHATRVKVVRRSQPFPDRAIDSEVKMLLSCIRRIGQTAPVGVSVKFYTYRTKNTTTLGVTENDED